MAKPAVKKAAAPARPDLIWYEVPQNSPEWTTAHLGKTTASHFADIMAAGEGKVRTRYMRDLAGEIITGKPRESYSNKAMERGHEMEAEIADHYERTKFANLKRVGFVFNPELNAGASPDRLIDDDGVLEVKSMIPALLIGVLEKGTMLPEHRAQCHGSMLVLRRKRCVLRVGYVGMPAFTAEVTFDPIYAREISDAIEKFNWERDQLVKKIKAMGQPI